MKPIKLVIKTRTEKYPIIIGQNLISNLSKILNKNFIKFKKSLIVIDKNVPNNFQRKIKNNLKKNTYVCYINANEKIRIKKQLAK